MKIELKIEVEICADHIFLSIGNSETFIEYKSDRAWELNEFPLGRAWGWDRVPGGFSVFLGRIVALFCRRVPHRAIESQEATA